VPAPPTVINSPNAPLTGMADGDLWFNTDTGREYVWYISPTSGLGSWVQTQPSGGGIAYTMMVAEPSVQPPSAAPSDAQRTPTITISAVPPGNPLVGDLWWSPVSGQQMVWYNDGNTSQWVVSNYGAGKEGPPGPSGLPVGGLPDQALTKVSTADDDVAWTGPYELAIAAGTTAQYWRGDKTWTTFPAFEPPITAGTTAQYWRGDKTWTTFPAFEPPITAGTTTQYWRGDKTWVTFPALEPPIAAGTTAQYWRGDKTWQTLDKAAVGLGNVDNTSDVNKPISTATQTALNGKEPTIAAGTTAQYWRGDKTWAAFPPTTPSGPAGGMLNGTYPNPGIAPSGTNGWVLTTVGGVATWAAATGGATITVSDTAPASPTAGALWWKSDIGQLFLYYQDPNTTQWVPAAPAPTIGAGPPPGAVMDFAGSTSPAGWLICDGSAVSRTTFAALFGAIGTLHGAGDGSTTFNLPDCRGRVTAGADGGAGRLTSAGFGGTAALAATGGGETQTLTIAQMPGHNHIPGMGGAPLSSQGNLWGYSNSSAVGNAVYYDSLANTGGGGAHQNVQPTIIMNKIIKT